MTADDIRTRLDAIEERAARALKNPGGQQYDAAVLLASDLPAVVAALRDALAEVEGQTLVARQYERERDAARAEIERLRGIVVRDDGMVLACDFHLVLVASDGEGEAREACPACEAQAARSRLVDATAQIKRLAAENARLRAQVQAVEALCPPGLTAHRIVYAFELRAALATEAGESPTVIDAAHLTHQREWSTETFGPGTRLLGVLDHIRKELAEIEADPTDLGEWIDVVILAFDGAWRAGWEPQQIIDAIKAKQARNEARTWPDWRTADADKAIEHVRANGAES